jgi:hypothetical protein
MVDLVGSKAFQVAAAADKLYQQPNQRPAYKLFETYYFHSFTARDGNG